MSPEEREVEDDRLRGVPNFLTNPGKKGTGYGYNDICLNPYPEYMYVNIYDSYFLHFGKHTMPFQLSCYS